MNLAWTGVVDDANGHGIALYQTYRNGHFYSTLRIEFTHGKLDRYRGLAGHNRHLPASGRGHDS